MCDPSAGDGNESVFLVVAGQASGIDLGEMGPKIAEALGGRGGGRAPIYQGKTESLEGRDAAVAILRSALGE